jgi:hypothetical protein
VLLATKHDGTGRLAQSLNPIAGSNTLNCSKDCHSVCVLPLLLLPPPPPPLLLLLLQASFTLPEDLHHKRLLFSGLIKLLPKSQPSIATLTVPYQGFAAPLKHLRLAARVAENSADGDTLRQHVNGLCYSPKVTPSFYYEVMDHLAKV